MPGFPRTASAESHSHTRPTSRTEALKALKEVDGVPLRTGRSIQPPLPSASTSRPSWAKLVQRYQPHSQRELRITDFVGTTSGIDR